MRMRCCSPPESWEGKCSRRSPSPTPCAPSGCCSRCTRASPSPRARLHAEPRARLGHGDEAVVAFLRLGLEVLALRRDVEVLVERAAIGLADLLRERVALVVEHVGHEDRRALLAWSSPLASPSRKWKGRGSGNGKCQRRLRRKALPARCKTHRWSCSPESTPRAAPLPPSAASPLAPSPLAPSPLAPSPCIPGCGAASSPAHPPDGWRNWQTQRI